LVYIFVADIVVLSSTTFTYSSQSYRIWWNNAK